MGKCVLGIDTSNYTTSVSVLDSSCSVLRDERIVLDVSPGERGLRQADALFQHVQNLPQLFERAGALGPLAAVGASMRPRPRDDSYMPVFLAGSGFGRSLAGAFGVPYFAFSHQEGHLGAGELDIGPQIPGGEFLAVHLSGGTTDVLSVHRRSAGYAIETIGESKDLHAGQFVDRVGVALGLPFPAGMHLERLAREVSYEGESERMTLPVHVEGASMSFSGPETAALRALGQGTNPSVVARAVEQAIAKGIEKALVYALTETGNKHVLIVGGVSANQFIRTRLKERLENRRVGMSLHFASPGRSTDNACGIAYLTMKALEKLPE